MGSPFTNVASSKYGGKCVDASSSKITCQWAIDGQFKPYDSDWTSNGGQTEWLKIDFATTYTVIGARFMQRVCQCGQNRKLKLTFSDGSTQQVCFSEV